VVICLERGADLHMAQLMPLPLTVSCLSEIQIGFTFLVPAHLGSPGQGVVKRVCVCVCVCVCVRACVRACVCVAVGLHVDTMCSKLNNRSTTNRHNGVRSLGTTADRLVQCNINPTNSTSTTSNK